MKVLRNKDVLRWLRMMKASGRRVGLNHEGRLQSRIAGVADGLIVEVIGNSHGRHQGNGDLGIQVDLQIGRLGRIRQRFSLRAIEIDEDQIQKDLAGKGAN